MTSLPLFFSDNATLLEVKETILFKSDDLRKVLVPV